MSDRCSFGIIVFHTLKRYIEFANRIRTKMTVLYFSHDQTMGSSLILFKSSSICVGHSNLSLVASFVGQPLAHANNPVSLCTMEKWFVLLLLFSIDINQTNIICNTIVICMKRYKFARVVTYRSNLAIVFTASLLSGKRPNAKVLRFSVLWLIS